MDSGFYAAVNGARRAEMRLEVLSNNLANVNTAGYKQDKIVFGSMLTSPGPEQHPLPTDSFMGMHGPGDIPFPYSNPSANAYRMTYPQAMLTVPDTSGGAMKNTGNPLHVAIEGNGYLAVDTPNGRRYTRDGSMQVNTRGELATKDGSPIAGEGGAPVVVGNGPVSIALDGTVSTPTGMVGRLLVVGLAKESMAKVGNNQYTGSEQALPPDGNVTLHQGFLEDSNTDMIHGMTDMVETNRAFETYMKMIQALDGLDGHAANEISKVG